MFGELLTELEMYKFSQERALGFCWCSTRFLSWFLEITVWKSSAPCIRWFQNQPYLTLRDRSCPILTDLKYIKWDQSRLVHWAMKALRACILFTYSGSQTSLVCSRLNEEARRLIAELGSTSITNLGFRDNWVFCGGKGIKTKSPFEQVCDSLTSWNLTACINRGIECFISALHLFKMGIYCSTGT